jgi:hypothetical protein
MRQGVQKGAFARQISALNSSAPHEPQTYIAGWGLCSGTCQVGNGSIVNHDQVAVSPSPVQGFNVMNGFFNSAFNPF